MNMRDFVAKNVAELPPSGIRKFFDVVATMSNVVSLGVGEPDFKTPEHVRQAAIDLLEEGRTRYTANLGMPALREGIAHYLERRFHTVYNPMDQIMCTIGASEAIDVALRTILEPGDEVLVIEPCYVSYKPSIILQHGVPVVVTTKVENDFKLMPEELERAITPKTKAIILPYPNNPTGAIMEKEDLEKMGELCSRFPELTDPYILKWAESDNIWLIRSAILFQLHYKERTDTELLASIISRNSGTKSFLSTRPSAGL